ncbi:MAG: hypothetical protein VX113_03165 [Pseudomonadota bacterium]|nr:hypothetical protein [Pseudomonadota bacterium]
MKKMTIGLLTAAAIAAMPVAGSALTLKKGQVLGSDGQIHDGASPDVRTRLIARAQDGGKSAGVTAGQLYVVVRDTITFVPITDIAGKSEETVKEIVVEKVTETITEALTEEALAAAGADINLAEEAAEAASEAEVNAALDQIAAADLAGIAAAEAAAATKEAWENINPEDLAEATAYAAEFAAQEAAKIIEHQNIDSQLQDLIDSGASAEQIAEFEANNPAPE